MPDALELLKIRRSVKPREMSGPGPSASELDTILTIGARVPITLKFTRPVRNARDERRGTELGNGTRFPFVWERNTAVVISFEG